jgi:hypothetical protein
MSGFVFPGVSAPLPSAAARDKAAFLRMPAARISANPHAFLMPFAASPAVIGGAEEGADPC